MPSISGLARKPHVIRQLAALFCAAPLAAFAVQDCELGGAHVNPNNGSTTAGKTGLMRCRDRDSGELQREQELRDGKFMGLVRFYEKGKLAREHSDNENGNRHGRAREFAPDGAVLSDSVYDNGSEVGLARRFYANGQLRRVVFFDKPGAEFASGEFNDRGQLSQMRCGGRPVLAPAIDDARLCGFAGGPSQVELFDGRGNLASRSSYASGERVRYEQLYGNGKTQLLRENSATRQLERQYAQDGVLRRETQRTLDGKAVTAMSLREFAESGTLVREQRWAAEKPVSDTSYYLNGQPRSKREWGAAEAAAWVDETQYRDDGTVSATGRYLEPSRGRRTATGVHKVLDPAGRVVAESHYDARGRVTRERAWDEGGKLLRDDEVFEDGSRKAYAR